MSGTFAFSFSKSSKDEDVLHYKNRIDLVESHFKELAKLVEKYAKTTAKLGQTGISISEAVCSSFEDLEPKGVAVHVEKFGKCLTSLQTEREQLASELSSKIAGDFRVYETKCSETKKEIDECNHLIVRENHEKEHLQKLQNKIPLNRRKFMESKVRLEKAQVMTNNSKNLLHEQMEEFESQKLHDSGRILREFVRTEMQFHARCLQIFTKAYQHLMKVPDANDNIVYTLSDEKKVEDSASRGVLFVKSRKKDSALSLSDLY
ncbi:hypothetical protein QZH41_006905 [Actinostola sp. cb2023]|nr:hypothetical protein QZH41_006905 [Actinostola sp. cb2023]